ncbi:MAG: hypothetical protein HRT89_19905 [Lentisphaeria bacterium]|nr:hypothetical protein [Lentisphaeria bacterium]NQZ70323.1 hypothetical protein [Lentisphaeria bacterium]
MNEFVMRNVVWHHLESLRLSLPKTAKDVEFLRSVKSLESINGGFAMAFWFARNRNKKLKKIEYDIELMLDADPDQP